MKIKNISDLDLSAKIIAFTLADKAGHIAWHKDPAGDTLKDVLDFMDIPIDSIAIITIHFIDNTIISFLA